ncbi:hypothetical protein N7516_008807, partial [Penicillium verrucosum]|uniref:uncharacterized protein n=1 Tax=Penicillium verrucosum TaxID=60171 RepID=UPI002544FC7D
MYGLCQSACLWYETIKRQLESLGFEQLPDERCIFWYEGKKKSVYGEDVGKVGWLTMRTRPDIAFVVNRLQRRTANPRKQDLEALSQLLRYLKGAPDYGINLAIQLAKDTNYDSLIGYVDSSYNDCEDGKSTEAYIFYYAGAPVLWSSRKQDI